MIENLSDLLDGLSFYKAPKNIIDNLVNSPNFVTVGVWNFDKKFN